MGTSDQPTLQQIIAAGLTDVAVAEHGRPLTRYTVEVTTDPIGPGVDGSFVVLKIYPDGFDYKAAIFGIDNNTLLNSDQLEARRQYLVNEARDKVIGAQTNLGGMTK